MADWDPFADPSDAADAPTPAAPAAGASAAQASEARDEGAMLEPWDSAGLPARPAAPADTLSLRDFVKRLDELCGDPEAARGIIDRKLKPLVVQAVGEQAPAMYSVLCRRLVALLADIREKRVKSQNLMWAIYGGFNDIGASMGGGLHISPPETEFSGSAVLVLGYGGSTLVDLADCVPGYRRMDPGCLIVTGVVPPGEYGRYQLADALEAIVNAWADGGRAPRLLAHLFSNMGYMAWGIALQLWQEQAANPDSRRLRGKVPPMAECLKGVVLDSSPDADVPKKIGIQSMIQSCAGSFAAASGCDADGKPLDARGTMEAAMEAKCEVLHKECPLRLFYEGLPESDVHKMTRANTAEVFQLEPVVPMQFVYSENDMIIGCSGVERHLAHCDGRATEAGATQPRRLKLQSSGHCLHKQTHEKAYWEALAEFWQLTMETA